MDSLKKQFSDCIDQPIDTIESVSGGCSYPAYLIHSGSQKIFVKTNPTPSDVFKYEALGLEELKKSGLTTPEILHWDSSHLFLSFIPTETPTSKFWKALGEQLALCHQKKGTQFGFNENGFIGAAEQINQCEKEMPWAQFFWENRLFNKIESIHKKGKRTFDPQLIDKLEQANYRYLNHDCHPSPLHGDFWSGNIICGPNQTPYFIDPAFYFGDREADIAMTECFGGFQDDFYSSYNSTYVLPKGYELRKHMYNLYHMLNHELIFGSQYQGTVDRIVTMLVK